MKQVVQGDGRKTQKDIEPTLKGIFRDIWGCFLCQIGSIGCPRKAIRLPTRYKAFFMKKLDVAKSLVQYLFGTNY